MQTTTLELKDLAPLAAGDGDPCLTASVHVAPVLLMRSGGLPLNCADELKDHALPAALARSKDLAAGIARYADALSCSLYSAVNSAKGDAALQHALLAIRRSVFNGRHPAVADIASATHHLDAESLSQLQEWLRLKQELDALSASAEERIKTSLASHRKALKQIALTPAFRKGILLSSPSFERALDDYIRSADGKLDKKLRRTERTLLSYLLRTTHKTSPFSTLTPVSMARLTNNAPRSWRYELADARLHTAVRPNLGIIARVTQALRRNATRHPYLRLAIESDPVMDGNRVKYWKRDENALKVSGPLHTKVSENTFWIHLTPSLRLLLRLMANHNSMTVAEISGALNEHLHLSESDALAYIRLLLDNGFLDLAGLRRSVFDPAYWTRVADELAPAHDSPLSQVAEGIRQVLHLAAEFEQADNHARPKLLQTVEAQVSQILELVGNEAPMPNPLLYEDARVGRQSISVSRAAFAAPFASFAELQRLLSLFDPFLVTKASLKSLFKKRYGAGGECHDLLGFSDFFHELFYRPYLEATNGGRKAADISNPFGRGTVNPLKLPQVNALQSARADFLEKIETELEQAGKEFEIPGEWVAPLGNRLKAWHGMLSNSFFFQMARLDGETVAVLNHVYSGFGCMFTRFMHLFESAGSESLEAAVRAHIESLQPPDVLFAELQGGHDTNLNQHPLLTDVELVFPGERGTRSAEKQIFIRELSLRHDAVSDEVYLYCHRLGKRIVPLYLGMFYPLVLPELQTLFLHFAPPSVLKSTLSPRKFPAAGSVLYQPRVRYRQVILERARWTVRTSDLPARLNQEKDYEYLLRFDRWRGQNGIPSEVFALLAPPDSGDPNGNSAGKGNGAGSGPQKPFYVDLGQPLLLQQLEKLAADNSGYMQFTECLPSPKDSVLCHAEDLYVSEFVVDITQGQPL